MHRWISGVVLLILAVGFATAETDKNNLELNNDAAQDLRGESGALDYETALRPAVLQKRSIANIARLLLGGNVPSNHPLVKYPEPKTWNLASNIMAALPQASSLAAAASSNSLGWAPPNNALQNIQNLFETKAKIIPYTGQVATGLTGLASVKGDLLRQLHSISTQAIAQAAAEAAARALAGAAAAHAVTNSIAHTVSPGSHSGINGGWSNPQNAYANPPGKTPGELPGPPYQSSSAHINHYQAPPSYNSNPFATPVTTPAPGVIPTLPSSLAYQQNAYQNQLQNQLQNQMQTQLQNQMQNGYYTLYNTQPATSAHLPVQTPYTPAPPAAHARPTLSPSTLIATTPSGYSPSLSNPIIPLKNTTRPIIVYAPGSNNVPLTSFRRTVSAGVFGRSSTHASSPSLLSTISSLLTASTAAYNAAFTGSSPGNPLPSAVFPNLLPSANSRNTASSVFNHSPISAPSVLNPGGGSQAGVYNAEFQRQSIDALSQGRGNYGGGGGSLGSNSLYNNNNPAGLSSGTYTPQASTTAFNTASYPFSQSAGNYLGQNYAQFGAIPYNAQSVQTTQFSGLGTAAGASSSGNYPGFSGGVVGSGYSGYNGGSGSSNGHVNGWNTQHAGSSPSASSWPASSNLYPSGYAGQASGNVNNPSGSFGGGAAQFPIASSSNLAQQAYSANSQNAYQSPASSAFAQASPSSAYSVSAQVDSRYQNAISGSNGVGGLRNSNLNYQYGSHDLRQSASTMGSEHDDDHSYQQAQRRNRPSNSNSYSSSRSRYTNPLNKKPVSSKRPNQAAYNSASNTYNRNGNGNSRRDESGKRVMQQGDKKGSQFDSSVDSVALDDHDEYYNEENEYNDSEDNHDTDPDDEHRWRSKNPSGQRTNSLHNHNSNGRLKGKAHNSKQAPSKNVRGNVGGSERVRSQPGRSKGGSGNYRNKKVPPRDREQQEKKRQREPMDERNKTEGANLHRGRVRQQQRYESRDVYTTLPEYVFQVHERPDIFIRPGGPPSKHGNSIFGRGTLRTRIGETDGTSSSRTSVSDKGKEEEASIRPSKSQRRKGSKKNVEKSSDSPRSLIETTPGGGEEEVLVSVSKAIDETSRADVLREISSDSGLITAEEFDPEEREAFVDDVYADDHHRRHDSDDEGEDEGSREEGEEVEK